MTKRTEAETKELFDKASRKCVTGVNGLRVLLSRKAKELGKNDLSDMMEIVSALIADFEKSYECKDRGNNSNGFGLWINLEIAKIK
jgi:hypothetical protein